MKGGKCHRLSWLRPGTLRHLPPRSSPRSRGRRSLNALVPSAPSLACVDPLLGGVAPWTAWDPRLESPVSSSSP